MTDQTKQIAEQFIDLFYLEGDPAQIEQLFEKVLTEAHAAGVAAERARVNKAIDALAHGDNLVGQSAYGALVALREAVRQ